MKIELKTEFMVDLLKRTGLGKKFDDVHIIVGKNFVNAKGRDKEQSLFYDVILHEGSGLKIHKQGCFNLQNIKDKAIKVFDRFDEDIMVGLDQHGEIVIKGKGRNARLSTCDDKLVKSWDCAEDFVNNFDRHKLSYKDNPYINGICVSIGDLTSMVKDAAILDIEFYKFAYSLKKKKVVGRIESDRDIMATDLESSIVEGDIKEIDNIVGEGFREIIEAIKHSVKNVWLYFNDNSMLITDKINFYYILASDTDTDEH